MAIIPGLMAGLVHPKIPQEVKKYGRSWPRDYSAIRLLSKTEGPRARMHYFLAGSLHTRYAMSAGRNPHELSSSDNFHEEPFWLTPVKEAIWALKSLFFFLLEQPSQLKYIEWPSFQSTLKTASLTLVLVALLIVALASVDSTLSYLLALLLRKTP